MPGVIHTAALMFVAAVGPTSVFGANLLYLGTLAAAYSSPCRGASCISLEVIAE